MGKEGKKRSVDVVEPRNVCEIPRVPVCFWTQVREGDHPSETSRPNMLSSLPCFIGFPSSHMQEQEHKKQILMPHLQARSCFSRLIWCGPLQKNKKHHTTILLISLEVWAVTLLQITAVFAQDFSFETLQVRSCKQHSGSFIVQYKPVAQIWL